VFNVSLADPIVAMVGLGIVANLVRLQRLRLPLIIEFAPFAVWILISAGISSFYITDWRGSAVLSELIKYAVSVGWFIVLSYLFQRPSRQVDFIWLWAITSVGVACHALLVQGTRLRNTGIMDNPNMLAYYLGVSAIVVTLFGTQLRFFHRALVRYMVLLLQVGAIVSTLSRTALVSALGVLAWICMLRGSLILKRPLKVVLGLFLGVLPLFLLFFTDSGSGLLQRFQLYESYSVRYRLLIWQRGLELWSHYPVTGIGLGQFNHLSAFDIRLHNQYLTFMVEAGLIGMLLFLLGLMLSMARLLRAAKAGNLACSLSGAVLSYTLVWSLTGNPLFFRPLWVALALGYAGLRSPPVATQALDARNSLRSQNI